jgi:16S rRNA (uracil1498-N3)-methyltransferase
MNAPFFYTEFIEPGNDTLVLDEDNSRHVVSVLRMQRNELLHLTDGKGNLVTAVITDPHKKKCRIGITGIQLVQPPARKTCIAVSLLKNPVRFEWLLEKATEIGITEIIPVLCNRTEKQHFRHHRAKNVLVSALVQSRQAWLPVLHEPEKFDTILDNTMFGQRFIAHCAEGDKKSLDNGLINLLENQLILVGPEGDFTAEEIALALQKSFVPVTLGNTRLRTETAGIAAAVLLKNAG